MELARNAQRTVDLDLSSTIGQTNADLNLAGSGEDYQVKGRIRRSERKSLEVARGGSSLQRSGASAVRGKPDIRQQGQHRRARPNSDIGPDWPLGPEYLFAAR
jgi:hypothetical protein